MDFSNKKLLEIYIHVQINSTFWLTAGWLRGLSGDDVGVAVGVAVGLVVGVVAVLVFDCGESPPAVLDAMALGTDV